MNEKAEVQQLKEQEDVKTALKQTAGTKETMPKPVPELRDKLWWGTDLDLQAFPFVTFVSFVFKKLFLLRMVEKIRVKNA